MENPEIAKMENAKMENPELRKWKSENYQTRKDKQ